MTSLNSEAASRSAQAGLDARAILALTGMAAFFSTNLIIGRAAIDMTGPWTLAFLRWTAAFLLILPFAWPALRACGPSLLGQTPRLFILGFLGMIVCGGGVYVALAQTTAVNATLIYSASPAFAVLLESLIARRRPGAAEIAGLCLAFLGVATIVLQGDLARAKDFSFNAGDLGVAAAALSWAAYGIMLRAPAFARVPTLASFASIAGAGTLLLALPALWEAWLGERLPDSSGDFAVIGALALFPSVLAFSLYQYGVKRVGAATSATFLYLMPAFGLLLAWLILDEALRPYHAAGFALVLGGVVLATGRKRT